MHRAVERSLDHFFILVTLFVGIGIGILISLGSQGMWKLRRRCRRPQALRTPRPQLFPSPIT
jgi:hypothetical protein